MMRNDESMARGASRRQVIALHCSGASAGQWRELAGRLGSGYELTAPEHYGGDITGPWTGEHAFTLADEAEQTIELIDRNGRPVHLVGHSYGGGVALHVALRRPDAIASLTLYEPSAFHLLRDLGSAGADALAEIRNVARDAGIGVITGDYRGAAARFVEYWSGKGAWQALSSRQQLALVRWLPKAPLDFAALIEEPAVPDGYSGLRIPALIMRGEHGLRPSRLVAETLQARLPGARLVVIAGADHMGPVTHGPAVNTLIASHITGVDSRLVSIVGEECR
jgi:pimeloyl-ACP methyl ester carboxylesterase